MRSASRAAFTVLCLVSFASPAFGFAVSWDINPAESNFQLTIPDQTVTLGGTSGTMRLRNQNNSAWTTNNAPVDGFLATDVGLGLSSIQFVGGSTLFGVNTGSYRPNPAAYNTASTNTANPQGQFTNATSASAVYAARINATAIITVNLGYISFSNVTYDVTSAVLAVSGGTSFATNTTTLGLTDSSIAVDGLSTIIGQLIPDTIAQSGPINAVNVNGAAGTLTDLGGTNYRITIPVNMPVMVSLQGVNLSATATGTLVGYATGVPEPSSLLLVVLGVAALGARRLRRR